VLLLGGVSLLFAADDILPRMIRGFPAEAAWLGQLLAAAWLGVANLNWMSRSMLLGGIYGRAVVTTNAVLYFVAATALLNNFNRSETPVATKVVAVVVVFFAAAYGWLMFRGPFERDFQEQRRRLGAGDSKA
jgi:hypothetical protein